MRKNVKKVKGHSNKNKKILTNLSAIHTRGSGSSKLKLMRIHPGLKDGGLHPACWWGDSFLFLRQLQSGGGGGGGVGISFGVEELVKLLSDGGSEEGVKLQSGGAGSDEGVKLQSGGSDEGVKLQSGGGSDEGVKLQSGGGSDEGVKLQSGGSDEGVKLQSGGSEEGVKLQSGGGGSDEGVKLQSGDSDEGVKLQSGGSDEGVKLQSGDGSDEGVKLQSGSSEDGVKLQSSGSAEGVKLQSGGSDERVKLQSGGGVGGGDEGVTLEIVILDPRERVITRTARQLESDATCLLTGLRANFSGPARMYFNRYLDHKAHVDYYGMVVYVQNIVHPQLFFAALE
jgi:hypothetical protein